MKTDQKQDNQQKSLDEVNGSIKVPKNAGFGELCWLIQVQVL